MGERNKAKKWRDHAEECRRPRYRAAARASSRSTSAGSRTTASAISGLSPSSASDHPSSATRPASVILKRRPSTTFPPAVMRSVSALASPSGHLDKCPTARLLS
jgi:hypothetical protein